MLLTPSMLVLVVSFLPLYRLNASMHLLHRAVFKGLSFWLPPSDATCSGLLPAAALAGTKGLSSKVRRRLQKRASLGLPASADAAGVELQMASIDSAIYPSSNSFRYLQFQQFIGVNLALLTLVFIEQVWICSKTVNNAEQTDGSVLAVEWGASTTSSTVLLLVCGFLYNLWVGLTILAGAQNATVGSGDGSVNGAAASGTRYWYRVTGCIGFLSLMGSARALGLGSSHFLLAADATQYKAYVNQLAFNALAALHAVFEKSAAAAGPELDGAADWIPSKPTSAADLHFDAYFPLLAFKLALCLICAALGVSFFTSAWRYSKLFVEKLEENTDMLSESSTNTGVSADDADDAAIGFFGKIKLAISTALHLINFLSPLAVALLWLPSASLHVWLRIFVPDPTDAVAVYTAWRGFELFRVSLVLLFLSLRLALLRSYIQAFLLSALGLIRALPRVSTVDHVAAQRIQTVLKSLFWYTPLMALQYVYPIVISLVLLVASKLAEEYMPPGMATQAAGEANINFGGWCACFALFGRGVAPLSTYGVTFANATASALDSEATPLTSAATVASPSSPNFDLDEDEFDGDLSSVHAADDDLESATSASASTLSDPSFASFHAPNSANILAAALGFLVCAAHLIWFVETALCVAYLRFARKATKKSQSAAPAAATQPEATAAQKDAEPAAASTPGLRARAKAKA